MVSNIKFELDVKPFLGQQAWVCPVCHDTRLSNLIEPKCKECKSVMELIQYNDKAHWDFNGQEIFLTWSQTPGLFQPGHIVGLAQEHWFKSSSNSVQDYLVTREPHLDGGWHLHGYFRFAKRFRTQNRSFFNLFLEDKVYTPNWQRVRGNKHKLFHYCKKDGEWNGQKGYISNFDPRPRIRQIVDDCNSWAEYWDAISYLGSDYWKMFASRELMAIKIKQLYGEKCFHKWVSTDTGDLYICINCGENRNASDYIKALPGVTKSTPEKTLTTHKLNEIFNGGDYV